MEPNPPLFPNKAQFRKCPQHGAKSHFFNLYFYLYQPKSRTERGLCPVLWPAPQAPAWGPICHYYPTTTAPSPSSRTERDSSAVARVTAPPWGLSTTTAYVPAPGRRGTLNLCCGPAAAAPALGPVYPPLSALYAPPNHPAPLAQEGTTEVGSPVPRSHWPQPETHSTIRGPAETRTRSAVEPSGHRVPLGVASAHASPTGPRRRNHGGGATAPRSHSPSPQARSPSFGFTHHRPPSVNSWSSTFPKSGFLNTGRHYFGLPPLGVYTR